MKENSVKIYYGLAPLAWLYGLGVCLRNKLFDWGWLRSKSFPVPIICIGNLAVGGTGKTPHTEYLIRLLQQTGMQVATLSRGYKRKSKGYVLADEKSDARQIGDEPYQMKNKFPGIRVAVDGNRCRGIGELLKLDAPATDVILLDDAFQHRHVKAGLNILLTDYHRLFCEDALIPAGRLREPDSGKQRAEIVIVTKCPADLQPVDYSEITGRLRLHSGQRLFFTRFRYGMLYPLYPEAAGPYGNNPILKGDEQVLLVTGIASPHELENQIRQRLKQAENLHLLKFADHHDFTAGDLEQIRRRFLKLKAGKRLIITTEKDAARLKLHQEMAGELKPSVYVLPIETEFLQNQQETFNQYITDYVRTNSRNSNLFERENAHTS